MDDYIDVADDQVGADEEDLTAPEIAAGVPDPTYVNPQGDPTKDEPLLTTKITGWFGDVGKWISDNPIKCGIAGFLIIGYFSKPKMMPWSWFQGSNS